MKLKLKIEDGHVKLLTDDDRRKMIASAFEFKCATVYKFCVEFEDQSYYDQLKKCGYDFSITGREIFDTYNEAVNCLKTIKGIIEK